MLKDKIFPTIIFFILILRSFVIWFFNKSGAYNRTLTPFGFQSESRSYWDAPEIYYNMSPFMHTDKMKTPLLLIHGEVNNNSGTYPLQSDR